MRKDATLPELFFVFFKIGLVTFGGGYTMIPYIYSEVLINKRWLGEDELIDILTISQSIPGAIAVNAAFNIGIQKRGLKGGLAAVLGMVIPAFLAIILIVVFFLEMRDSSIVQKFMLGVITSSAALICVTTIKMSKNTFKKHTIKNVIITTVVFIAIGLFKADIIWLLLLGVFIGFIKYIRDFNKNKQCKDKEHLC